MRISGLERAYASIMTDLDRTHQLVRQTLRNEHAELEKIDTYVYSARGKMLRPALVFLSGYGAVPATSAGDKLVTLATVFELLHGASLVHDDILDEEAVRRHLPTLHTALGPHIAVLAGDVLFTQAFALLSRHFDNAVTEPIVSVALDMCHGEILAAAHRGATERKLYEEIVTLKTARMMGAAGRTGALVAGARDELVELFGEIGLGFGRAYQLLDDLVDDDHPLEDRALASALDAEIAHVRELLESAPRNEASNGIRGMVSYIEAYAAQSAGSRLETTNRSASGVHYPNDISE